MNADTPRSSISSKQRIKIFEYAQSSNVGMERTWPSSGCSEASMTRRGFVVDIGQLEAGHAAHPGCWADTSRQSGASAAKVRCMPSAPCALRVVGPRRKAWPGRDGIILIGALALLNLVGCDRFFRLEIHVTECESREPIAGVRGRLTLDKGFGEEERVVTSGPDGRLTLLLNEPPNAWATLVLEANGYGSWTRQFRGAPREQVKVCLQSVETASDARSVWSGTAQLRNGADVAFPSV
jgi:hypothetical protein